MLNLKEIYEKASLIRESKQKHIFENGKITFADIRDAVKDVFNGGIMLSKKVPSVEVFITYKDGDFCVQTDCKKLKTPYCCRSIPDDCCQASNDIRASFKNTINDIVQSLSQLDQVLLNKYFANGQNFMRCQLIYPPEGQCGNYNDRCFVNFNDIQCYDKKFKAAGNDQDSAAELFDKLNQDNCLSYEVSEIPSDKIEKIKKCVSGKKVIDIVMPKLNAFINGVGWNCPIDSYIEDRYSRYIINKALEYGLDVSRNSSFVNELVTRLSGTSSSRPTKSDLVTFAKREGIDCHSDEYKNFLSDIEGNAQKTNQEIISPIENLMYYIVSMALKNIMIYMSLDPSQKTQKVLSGLDCSYCDVNEGDQLDYSIDKHEQLKKNISKVEQYSECLPKNIIIMYKKTPYSIVSTVGKLQNICKLINFK